MSNVQLYACLGSGNCYKPWLAMNQIGVPFDLHLVDVLKGEQKEPDFLKVNPLGVVPYMRTPTGEGIGESNAMLWYLCEGSKLMPETTEQRAKALQWMFFEQSKLEPFISPARFFTTILPDLAEEKRDEIHLWQEQARPGLAYLDGHLTNNSFLLGETYTITDIAVFGYTHVLEEAGLSLGHYPHVERWIEDVSQTENFVPLSDLGKDNVAMVA
ncbi:MAG: glutathione S-transferase family protein [Litoreibacter sp.]|nr:glutathione S-transferase family protein [Litoreibacter sp.]MCY4333191.1 glutathione S-transferase family protein [Litoreibacter sp.]